MKYGNRNLAAPLVVLLARDAAAQSTVTTPPEKKLPMLGEVFRVEGCAAFVIPPDKATTCGPVSSSARSWSIS